MTSKVARINQRQLKKIDAEQLKKMLILGNELQKQVQKHGKAVQECVKKSNCNQYQLLTRKYAKCLEKNCKKEMKTFEKKLKKTLKKKNLKDLQKMGKMFKKKKMI